MMAATLETLHPPTAIGDDNYGRYSTGILPSHVLKRLLEQGREITASEPFAHGQIQPASIDLRLGPVAYRVRASFLPGPAASVEDKLKTVFMHEVDLTRRRGAGRQAVFTSCRCWSGRNSRPGFPAAPIRKAPPGALTSSPA